MYIYIFCGFASDKYILKPNQIWYSIIVECGPGKRARSKSEGADRYGTGETLLFLEKS